MTVPPKKVLVVGSGFEGIYAAHRLKETYGAEVTLIDASPRFAGIMAGAKHLGFAIDFGCQVFDNFDPEISREIDAISGGQTFGVDITYGARNSGVNNYETSIIDLSSKPADVVERMLMEVQASTEDGHDASTLAEYYERRYGPTAAAALNQVNRKLFGMEASELDAMSRVFAGLSRVRMTEAERSMALKQSSELLDAKLAVARAAGHRPYPDAFARLPYNNLHPTTDSFAGYSANARATLDRIGVDVRLGIGVSSITETGEGLSIALKDQKSGAEEVTSFDRLVWTSKPEQLVGVVGDASEMQRLISPMGMHLVYGFCDATQISDLGYFQNFDDDLSFYRWSAMGIYSRQINDAGQSFCCIELPAHDETRLPEDALSAIWDETRDVGLVTGEMSASHYVFAPKCIRRYLPGYKSAAQSAMDKVDASFPHITYLKPDLFGRVAAAAFLRDRLNQVMDATR